VTRHLAGFVFLEKEMTNQPYFDHLANSEWRQRLAGRAFMRLINADPSRQSELFDLYQSLPVSTKDYIRSEITYSDFDYRYIPARFRIDNQLAITTRHSVLHGIETDYENCDDWGEIKDYITDNHDIVECPECGHLEWDDCMLTSWEEDSFCRDCETSGNYRFSDYYDSYVRDSESRWALSEDGSEVLISCEDSCFVYNDDLDRYVHEYYEFEPEIIGRYHSSKGQHRKQQSPWTRLKKRYIGVELEVECVSTPRQDKAGLLHSMINDEEFGKNVFFENDGSLNNGFEIISQPMGLDKHKELWSFLNDKNAVRGLRSHNTSTCGLHVHISKDGLTKLQIAKIVSFVNDPDNEPLIRAIARRYAEGYCKIKSKKIGSSAYSEDRYEAVNITGRSTIEFRIFKGSLKYESVMAAIQFSNALVEFCGQANASIQDLKADKFIEWINEHESEDTEVLRPYIEQRLELA
jgi:hypothetical protein